MRQSARRRRTGSLGPIQSGSLRSRGLGAGFGPFGEAGEGSRARNGELGEALAIERDAGVLEAADELAVGQAILACRGVDPDHPQPTEVALLPAPADERI